MQVIRSFYLLFASFRAIYIVPASNPLARPSRHPFRSLNLLELPI